MKQSTKKQHKENLEPVEKFLRIIDYGILPGEGIESYQIEEITAQGNTILDRQFLTKRDTLQMVLGKMRLFMVPNGK